MSETISPEDRDTLESLIGWWEESGIEVERPQAVRKTAQAARPAPAPKPAPVATAAKARAAGFARDVPAENGRELAQKAQTLEELKAALAAFNGCSLKHTARQMVFSRGNPEADLMIVGEAPGKEEDEQGKPFVGRSGQLLDRMLASIGLDESQFYITNIVNWRPPGNRKPTDEEIEACRPFCERHIALVKPKVLVFAGGISAQTLLKAKSGIMGLRGRWDEFTPEGSDLVIPALPLFHPAFLLRRPIEKKKAWQDLLRLKERLSEL